MYWVNDKIILIARTTVVRNSYFGKPNIPFLEMEMESFKKSLLLPSSSVKYDLKYRLCFRRALDARQAAHHVLQFADSEPVLGSTTRQPQRPRPGVRHTTAQGGGQQLGDH
jgi:hypothetical protein